MTVKRITFLQGLLGMLGLGERLDLAWISSAEAQRFVQVVTDFTDKIKSLGPNPISTFSDKSKAAAAGLLGLDLKETVYEQQSQNLA
jgi:F420-non-reducing hydrogenase iron-sulfur subunit